jgi:hypothetical protein
VRGCSIAVHQPSHCTTGGRAVSGCSIAVHQPSHCTTGGRAVSACSIAVHQPSHCTTGGRAVRGCSRTWCLSTVEVTCSRNAAMGSAARTAARLVASRPPRRSAHAAAKPATSAADADAAWGPPRPRFVRRSSPGQQRVASQWSCLSTAGGIPHCWGTQLGVWTRPPAQADPLATETPTSGVELKRRSDELRTTVNEEFTNSARPPGGCSGPRVCQHAQLGIPETSSRADSGTPPAASRQLHSSSSRVQPLSRCRL